MLNFKYKFKLILKLLGSPHRKMDLFIGFEIQVIFYFINMMNINLLFNDILLKIYQVSILYLFLIQNFLL